MRQLIFTWTVLVAMILAGAGFEARAQDQWNRPPIQGGQGTQLHGTGEYEHVNLKLEGRRYNKAGTKWSDCAVSLEKGVLRSRCDLDGNPAGVTFIAAHQGGIAYFTVLEAKAGADAAAGQYQYKVAVSASPPGSPGSPEPQPLCGAYALAVPYAWSTSGELLADEKEGAHYFTFACPGGVIAKCISWGYVPWATGAKGTSAIDGAPLLYDDPTAQRFHQTCVRLASADYCGEGNSNTVDGTPVGITNVANTLATKAGGAMTLASSPPPDQFRLTAGTEPLGPADAPELEGVWGFDHCGRARVLCLGRERWDTLSLAATCTDGVMARRLVAAPPPYSTDCAQAVATKRSRSIQAFRCKGGKNVFESETVCNGRCGQKCLREQYELESDLTLPLPRELRPGARDERPPYTIKGYHCGNATRLFEQEATCSRQCRVKCALETLAFDSQTTVAPGTCGPPPPPKLCDQWTVEDLKNEGATLFSYSSRWTKELVSFSNPKSGERITTSDVVHVFPLPADGSDPFQLNPEKFQAAADFTLSWPEGRLFKESLPKPVKEHLGTLLKLYRCQTPDGRSVTSTTPGSGACTVEGLIYADRPNGIEFKELWLYQTSTGGKPGFLTTTVRNPQGDTLVGSGKLLGYIPVRSQLSFQPRAP